MEFTRRTGLAALTLGVLATSGIGTATAGPTKDASEEAQLQKLYKQALAEGGTLTVYAGGSEAGQNDFLKDAFVRKFPNIKVNIVVDYSSTHDARIDNQIAERHVVADVVHIQNLDDYPRWKKEGVLERYKPVGWDRVYGEFKDREGYYTGLFVVGFSNVTATKLGDSAPVEAQDFLKPEFKNRLAFTYPNGDDAVLYYFKQLTDTYGFDYLKKLLGQNPTFVRDASHLIGTSDYDATFGTAGGQPGLSQQTYPQHSPWIAWPQTGAILKNAPHKAAAKLYLSWVLSKQTQQDVLGSWAWSVRNDVAAPSGRKGIFDYKNMNPLGLRDFMSDRAALDRYKALITLYVGEVKGVKPSDPKNILGLYPVDQNGTQG
ncbi:extracellular solute-binding protein [Streptomyces sp. DSM 41524]|uniref:Extracellular solute-binding protein n=1 Tax=Streptomyces asiaticus subsp. ignotus TaxID=3098222 RepID=A0ABU7QAM5_9ACTN|nr:extracellular solute-binding protein [Streptomyces sp. DSM 41524]